MCRQNQTPYRHLQPLHTATPIESGLASQSIRSSRLRSRLALMPAPVLHRPKRPGVCLRSARPIGSQGSGRPSMGLDVAGRLPRNEDNLILRASKRHVPLKTWPDCISSPSAAVLPSVRRFEENVGSAPRTELCWSAERTLRDQSDSSRLRDRAKHPKMPCLRRRTRRRFSSLAMPEKRAPIHHRAWRLAPWLTCTKTRAVDAKRSRIMANAPRPTPGASHRRS
jgi:hypothetical protein